MILLKVLKFRVFKGFYVIVHGFVKSNNHRPTDHQPLNHLTTDQPTHRPSNKILFQRLDNYKIFILQNTITAGKM